MAGIPVVNGVISISYNPYKWPKQKWEIGVITLLIGVITSPTLCICAHNSPVDQNKESGILVFRYC